MQIDKTKFIEFLKDYVNKSLFDVSQKQKDFIFKKGEQLIDLINEIGSKGFLKELTKDEIGVIDKKSEPITKNIEELGKMTLSFLDMVTNNTNAQGAALSLKDSLNNEYRISAHQIAIIIGMTYSSFCEYNRFWLMQIIDLSKMKDKKGNKIDNEPNGIGALRKILKTNKITKLEFFDHIDSNLRNSFFHLNFKFDGMKLYCKNNTGRDYIGLHELINGTFDVDRSGFVLMCACRCYFNFFNSTSTK